MPLARPILLVPTAVFAVVGVAGAALHIFWLAGAGLAASLGALLTYFYLTRRAVSH